MLVRKRSLLYQSNYSSVTAICPNLYFVRGSIQPSFTYQEGMKDICRSAVLCFFAGDLHGIDFVKDITLRALPDTDIDIEKS